MNILFKSPRLRELYEPLSSGPRRFLAFLFFNVISYQAFIGTVMVLHARALGINAKFVGIFNSFIYFSGILGIVTKPLAERIGSRRLLMGGWTLRYIVTAPVIAIPWVYMKWGPKEAAVLLGCTTLLFCMTRSLAGIAWSSWLHEIIPPEHLARYYTLESMQSRLLVLAFGVMAFFILGNQTPLWRFSILTTMGVITGLFSIRFLARVPGGAPNPSDKKGRDYFRGFLPAIRDKNFSRLLFFAALSSFAQSGQGLIFALMLRDCQNIGAGTILFLTSIGNIITLPTSLRWRRIADSHGSPITLASTTLLLCLCFAAMTPLANMNTPFIIIVILATLIPIAETGGFIANTRAMMLYMDPRYRHAYNAVWSAGMAIGGGTASILSGAFVNIGGKTPYIIATVINSLLMLVAASGFIRLRENNRHFEFLNTELYKAGKPLKSVGKIWGYVLRPASSRVKL